MKKTQCQLSDWVTRPPASSPSDPPPAIVKANTLIARRALARFGEAGDDDGDDHARRQGAAEPLSEPRRHEQLRRPGGAADRRGDGEQEDPHEEDPLAAHEVAKTSGQEDEASIADRVDV